MDKFNKKNFDKLLNQKEKMIVLCFFAKWHIQFKKTLSFFNKLGFCFRNCGFMKIDTNDLQGI